MSKINYLTTETVLNQVNDYKKADLKFDFRNENGDLIEAYCNTIMDFIDAMENNEAKESDIPMLDYTDVHAKFFDNKLNEKDFDTISDLLEHCKMIIK